MDYGEAELRGQERCLIEAAAVPTPRMERDRYYAVGARQEVRSVPSHPLPEFPRERSPPLVLEEVDDALELTSILANRPAVIDGTGRAPAAGAPGVRVVRDAPRRERIAAGVADRRRDHRDG